MENFAESSIDNLNDTEEFLMNYYASLPDIKVYHDSKCLMHLQIEGHCDKAVGLEEVTLLVLEKLNASRFLVENLSSSLWATVEVAQVAGTFVLEGITRIFKQLFFISPSNSPAARKIYGTFLIISAESRGKLPTTEPEDPIHVLDAMLEPELLAVIPEAAREDIAPVPEIPQVPVSEEGSRRPRFVPYLTDQHHRLSYMKVVTTRTSLLRPKIPVSRRFNIVRPRRH